MTAVMGDLRRMSRPRAASYREMVARLLALLRDAHRPVAFSVVFWLVVVLVIVRYVIVGAGFSDPAGYEHSNLYAWQHVLFALNLAALLALWPVLPWGQVASWPRGLAGCGFLLASLALGMTGSAGLHYPLILVGFAAVALAYGVRVAAIAVAGVSVVLGVLQMWSSPSDLLGVVSELAVLALGAVFVLGMVAATREARRQREESERLLARVRELTVAEERARMARDMHDSMGHHLTVIKMGLENAERFRTRRPDAAWDEVRQSKQLTGQALAETRRWVRALRPLDLDGQVGSAALERLARSFSGSGVTVEFTLSGTERQLDADTELVLYRVLQEGLTNVLRHADATRVGVRLAFGNSTVRLSIGDDGRGAGAEPGFGLTSLAERVAAQGGRLRTHTGNGTGNGTGTGTGTGFKLLAELPVGNR